MSKVTANELTFTFTPATVEKHHYLEVAVNGVPAGGMLWHARSGELYQITVGPEFRRRGVATALWRRARAEDGGKRLGRGIVIPVHSPRRTDEGDAWAASTGDPMPDLQPAYVLAS